ncbi:hypothetical protein [Mucilaginibacter sp.]|jgi:hypothetical protein|nr:hypothetical protein [Mucilaginibacter sp.]
MKNKEKTKDESVKEMLSSKTKKQDNPETVKVINKWKKRPLL